MDQVFLLISFAYVICFFAFCIAAQFVKISITKIQLSILFLLLNAAFCLIAYYSTDGSGGWDLNRYYTELDKLRRHNFSYALKYGHYKETVLANVLFYLISRTNDNCLLQVISTFVSFSILSYIAIDLKFNKSYKLSSVLLYFLIFFGVISFATLLLGVRWILAMSFVALAAYKENDKPFNVFSIILYVAAALIHNGVLLFIIVRIISCIKVGWIKYFIVLFTFALPYMQPLAAKSAYLTYAYDKIIQYSAISASDKRVFIVYLCYLACFICCAFFQNKNDTPFDAPPLNNKNRVFKGNFLAAVLGSVRIYHLMTRSLGVYYFAFPESTVSALENKKLRIVKYVLIFLTLGMYAYQFVFFKTYWRFRIL